MRGEDYCVSSESVDGRVHEYSNAGYSSWIESASAGPATSLQEQRVHL